MRHPNAAFVVTKAAPLLERNPVRVWQGDLLPTLHHRCRRRRCDDMLSELTMSRAIRRQPADAVPTRMRALAKLPIFFDLAGKARHRREWFCSGCLEIRTSCRGRRRSACLCDSGWPRDGVTDRARRRGRFVRAPSAVPGRSIVSKMPPWPWQMRRQIRSTRVFLCRAARPACPGQRHR